MSSGVVWLFIAGFFVLTILIKYQVKAAMLIIIISGLFDEKKNPKKHMPRYHRTTTMTHHYDSSL